MKTIDLIIRLHEDAKRQGPGDDGITKTALAFITLPQEGSIRVVDIGCGSGAQTMVLAENIAGEITALDLHAPFLKKLDENAHRSGLSHKIRTRRASMEKLPLKENQYDLIWSEGAIYNMGFRNGLREWKKYLKENGFIAITEISWLTGDRPKELDTYWKKEYGEIDTVSNKIKIIEDLGYRHIAAFTLPEYCWQENYYLPLKSRFKKFLEDHDSEEARLIVRQEEMEMEIYEKYKNYYSYVFYIAQNQPPNPDNHRC